MTAPRSTAPPGRWLPLRRSGPSLRPPVAWQAVQQWIADGFSAVRRVGGHVLVNMDALEAWRAKFRTNPDDPGHGGRRAAARERAARPRRDAAHAVESAARDPHQGDLFERRPLPITEAQILERARAGDLTTVELKQALDALGALERIRESAKEAGRLLDAEDVEREAASMMTAVRSRLEQVPARLEKQAIVELGLAAAVASRVRSLADEEVRAVCAALADNSGAAKARGAGASAGRRTR